MTNEEKMIYAAVFGARYEAIGSISDALHCARIAVDEFRAAVHSSTAHLPTGGTTYDEKAAIEFTTGERFP